MSYLIPKPGPRQVGRPKGSGKIKPEEEKSTYSTKLSPLLIAMIQPERRSNESYSDVIVRLLSQKGKKVGTLQKKVDALEEAYQRLESKYNTIFRDKNLMQIVNVN